MSHGIINKRNDGRPTKMAIINFISCSPSRHRRMCFVRRPPDYTQNAVLTVQCSQLRVDRRCVCLSVRCARICDTVSDCEKLSVAFYFHFCFCTQNRRTVEHTADSSLVWFQTCDCVCERAREREIWKFGCHFSMSLCHVPGTQFSVPRVCGNKNRTNYQVGCNTLT